MTLPATETLTVEFKSDRKRLPDDDLIEAVVCLTNAGRRAVAGCGGRRHADRAACRASFAGGPAVPAAREHFIRWYSDRARVWLSSRVADYQSRMEVSPAGVKVRDLGYRWGSCGKGDWLYFHWKAILLPARIAEYVVVHEIAHLYEPHHTLAFWLRVERAMPDYAQRKAWLAEHGMDVEEI